MLRYKDRNKISYWYSGQVKEDNSNKEMINSPQTSFCNIMFHKIVE